MSNQKRILFYDLETSFNQLAAFNLWERGGMSVPHENILSERYVICASWKWAGSKKIYGVSVLDDMKRFKVNPHDDLHVIRTLHDVLSEADVIVAHNGDRFDRKYHAARALINGLPALPPIASIDTLKVSRGNFLLNSHRLDYLASILGIGRKKATPRGLWIDVLKGDEKAVRTMLAYNKHDVVLLEAVYNKLLPFIKKPMVTSAEGCPRCGSKNVQARGSQKTATQEYQRFQCQACSGWFRSAKAQKRSSKVRVL